MRVCGTAAAVGALVLATACAANPVTGNRELALMTEARELSIGRDADVQIREQMGVYDSPALQAYVEDLGHRLAALSHRPNLPWQFAIVDSPAVNAFAVPGGYIYLTRGILAYLGDEAELAGVLGHEIGHVTARHSVQAYSRAAGAQIGLALGQILVPPMRSNPYGLPGLVDAAASGLGILLLKFGRDDEMQADRLGAEYAAEGGWHPQGVAGMLATLGRIGEASDRRGVPNWLSTHPEPAARVAEVGPTVAALLRARDPGGLRVGSAGYLDRIVGLRFGDNPEDGIARANEFLHPELRFGLQFPAGWEIRNSAALVAARPAGQDAYMVLRLIEDAGGADLRALAEREIGHEGLVAPGNRTTINGLDAYLGSYQRDVDDAGRVHARVAYIRHIRRVYVLAAVVPVREWARVERDVDRSIRSFRPLTAEEADRIVPNEIALHVAGPDDTWERIARGAGAGTVEAATLAIMNGHAVGDPPRPGERLKIVVPGSVK